MRSFLEEAAFEPGFEEWGGFGQIEERVWEFLVEGIR